MKLTRKQWPPSDAFLEPGEPPSPPYKPPEGDWSTSDEGPCLPDDVWKKPPTDPKAP